MLAAPAPVTPAVAHPEPPAASTVTDTQTPIEATEKPAEIPASAATHAAGSAVAGVA
jgi:hypothetical protein